MNAGKRPVRFSKLTSARAPWKTMHPQPGDLPAVFVLEFGQASGPAAVSDGRALIVALTPGELAAALSALPALSLATASDDDIRAYKRITTLLRGETGP
jgi:hypothetical protein